MIAINNFTATAVTNAGKIDPVNPAIKINAASDNFIINISSTPSIKITSGSFYSKGEHLAIGLLR